MVIPEIAPDALKRALCDLTFVERGEAGLIVDLPQIYHSGDVVTIVVQPEPGGFYVHDGSGAAMNLESHGTVIKTRLYDHLRERVALYQCEFENFRVSKRCTDIEKLAATVSVVGCASRIVADYVAATDQPPLFDFRRQLVDRLYERFGSPRVRENEEVVAITGSHYHVSAVLLDSAQSRPVAYIEPVGNHAAVTRKFRTFYDFSKTPLVKDTKRIIVYDSLKSGISSGDVALLRDVSEPFAYQESDSVWPSLQ